MIKKGAAVWGITLETGVRIERVLSEFFAPLPGWVAWLVDWQLKKYANNPKIGYIPAIKALQWQGLFAAMQALSFLAFLIAGFTYAAAI